MNRGDGSKSRSITVNEGGDKGCSTLALDSGLTASQLIMQIATSDAQVNRTMPLL
jgi:hypothetical protein